MNRIFIVIIGLLILVSCDGLEKKEFKFNEVGVEDCMGKRKKLYLPIGWTKSERNYYGEGFMETYNYSDKSVISLLCGANAELSFSELFDEEKYSRKESSVGRTIMYENVPKERKMEFDAAFDKMME
ncbi:MAG: hypothetical protein ABJI22_06935 [Maribacter sp.]